MSVISDSSSIKASKRDMDSESSDSDDNNDTEPIMKRARPDSDESSDDDDLPTNLSNMNQIVLESPVNEGQFLLTRMVLKRKGDNNWQSKDILNLVLSDSDGLVIPATMWGEQAEEWMKSLRVGQVYFFEKFYAKKQATPFYGATTDFAFTFSKSSRFSLNEKLSLDWLKVVIQENTVASIRANKGLAFRGRVVRLDEKPRDCPSPHKLDNKLRSVLFDVNDGTVSVAFFGQDCERMDFLKLEVGKTYMVVGCNTANSIGSDTELYLTGYSCIHIEESSTPILPRVQSFVRPAIDITPTPKSSLYHIQHDFSGEIKFAEFELVAVTESCAGKVAVADGSRDDSVVLRAPMSLCSSSVFKRGDQMNVVAEIIRSDTGISLLAKEINRNTSKNLSKFAKRSSKFKFI